MHVLSAVAGQKSQDFLETTRVTSCVLIVYFNILNTQPARRLQNSVQFEFILAECQHGRKLVVDGAIVQYEPFGAFSDIANFKQSPKTIVIAAISEIKVLSPFLPAETHRVLIYLTVLPGSSVPYPVTPDMIKGMVFIGDFLHNPFRSRPEFLHALPLPFLKSNPRIFHSPVVAVPPGRFRQNEACITDIDIEVHFDPQNSVSTVIVRYLQSTVYMLIIIHIQLTTAMLIRVGNPEF